jgi:O-antigen ligase
MGRKTYHYAHNDILQFLAEYGLFGCGFLVALLSTLFWVLVRSIERFASGVLILLLGLFVMLSHAFIDFTLSSPAYLIATIGFYALAAKLLTLERRHVSVITTK